MAKNHKLPAKASHKSFKANAVKGKSLNVAPPIMRGGIRL